MMETSSGLTRECGRVLICILGHSVISNAGEVVHAARDAVRTGAALGQYSDLGAAIAGQRLLVVFGVGAQKPLHVPSPPLPLDFRLHLKHN